MGLYAICVWNWHWWLTQDHFLIKHWSQHKHRCSAPVVGLEEYSLGLVSSPSKWYSGTLLSPHVPEFVHAACTQITKTLRSTSIRHRSNAKASDRYLIDIDARVFAIWVDIGLDFSIVIYKTLPVLSGLNPTCSSFPNLPTLRWRHNWRDSVSNHQPHGCLLQRLFRRRSKKTSKLRVTGFCAGNSPGPVNSRTNGQ